MIKQAYLRSTASSAVLATILVAAGAPQSALAQDETAQPQGGLDRIVVTAERREQNLQEVPIAATVLSGEELAKRGVNDINALQQVAPSVAISTFNRSVFINIRGVGIAQSAPTSNPGVAYYIDGQLIPHEQFIRQSFFDIESIEVLRGPQGTLTGQNSTGGAIYVRTPEPDFDSYSASADVTYGNYDKFRSIGAVNLGVSENLAMRLAVVHEEQDSFTANIGPSVSQPGNMNLDAFRANIAFRTTDEAFKLNLRTELFDYQTDNNAVKNRNDAVTPDPFVIEEDAVSFLDQKGARISGEARYALTDGLEARGLVSWQDGWTRDQTDGDRTATAPAVPIGLPANGANRALYPGRVSNARTDYETLIAEFNLISTGDGPVQWVVGGFFLDEDVPVILLRDNYNTLDFSSSTSTIDTLAHNNSKSLFGQVNWFVTPKIETLFGLRHSWDKQDYTRFALPGPPRPEFTTTQKSSEFTGKLGLNYHMDNGTLLYVSASKGYKAGGVNLEEAQGNFGPESNFVYEAGIKTELLDNHLRVNADVYYSDYKDIQLASLQGGLPVTQNAASGEAWGAELEMQAQFGQFGATLGVGYLNAEFAKDVCINDTNATTPDPDPNSNCTDGNALVPSGRVLPYSPEWTANAGVNYEILLPNGMSLTPRIQWAHLSTQYATPFPSTLTLIPSRHVFDARLSLAVSERVTVEGYMNNFADKTYIASQIQNSSSADGGSIYGAPRTYGVRAVVNIGG